MKNRKYRPKVDPIAWVKNLVKVHGWYDAERIVKKRGRALIGNQNDTPNPFRNWYQNAEFYINKHKPVKEEA